MGQGQWWQRAASCRVVDDCRADARRHGQRGVIRAGVPYGDDGKPLSDAQLAARTRGQLRVPIALQHAS